MDKITIYAGGASKGNPGPAVIRVLVVDSKGNTVLEVSESIGNASSDYAEYFAVVRALQAIVEKLGEKTKDTEFELKIESELVMNHLRAKAEIKDVSLIGHFIEIYNLRVASFPNLKLTLVETGQNKEVASLVKAALDA
ncbi:reverse transcriptase-like protein [Candidatus Nomurabacteria bacterium]|nr:reverse transcriptase-like protein [Candidatus Kaiserbacteria bacterium]MCB9815526.1 reverse transcriptase-like protein [Candidatus Nomurabacteria bacterium]